MDHVLGRYDDPEVVQLRSQLDLHAGIPELEVIDPASPGYAQRAAFLLNRDGVRCHVSLRRKISRYTQSVDLFASNH